MVDALAELIQTCSVLVPDLFEPDTQLCERGAVAYRGPLLLARALPVIASRSALRTSAAEERPAIPWLFVVGNVQFSGEP